MKKYLSVILIILMLLSMLFSFGGCEEAVDEIVGENEELIEDPVQYYEEVVLKEYAKYNEGVSISFNKWTGTLKVSGRGKLYGFFPRELDAKVRNVNWSIKYIEVDKGIELIDDSFNYCYGLKEVRFPKMKMVNCAFRGCNELKKVDASNVSGLIESFDQCSALEEVKFDNAERAFLDCDSLHTAIGVGERIVGSFGWCDALETVRLDRIKYANNSFGACPKLKVIDCGEEEYTPEELVEIFVDPSYEDSDYGDVAANTA